MAYHALTDNFTYFFKRLNPSSTFEQKAASEYKTLKDLIENSSGPASTLSPICFLQGSYKQDTAIYTINDIDIVALCKLWQPGSGVSRSWSRDEIFDTIATPLLSDNRYAGKVRYDKGSMCIKVDLGIKVEILPVVYQSGNSDPQKEPFRLYRPEKGQWEDGYAQLHQSWLTWKNDPVRTKGNFKPAIKVLKHLRSKYSLDVVSFHLECLLFALPDYLFLGGPADYLMGIFNHISSMPSLAWYNNGLTTPCGERNIFNDSEWKKESWENLYRLVNIATRYGNLISKTTNRDMVIQMWQELLGSDFFPSKVY